MSLTMYDAIPENVGRLPSGDYYAGYVDGIYQSFDPIRSRFPHARVMSIAVFTSGNAECLDVEPGDATEAEIYGWFKRMEADKVWRPCVYSSVVNVNRIGSIMTANGFSRGSYRIWSAHYGAGEHICGPGTCRLTQVQCDGTQWASNAYYDTSILSDDFFGGSDPKPKPKPKPKPQPKPQSTPLEDDMPLWDTAAKASCPVLVPYGTGSVRLLSTTPEGSPLKVMWTFIDEGKDAESVTLDWGTAGPKSIDIKPQHDTARLDVIEGEGPLVAIQFDPK